MPEGVVLDQSELTGMYARVDLAEGIPISRRNLTNEPSFASLPVTPGNRAVPIRLDDVASQENHFLPGTRVDVVLTYHENRELTSKVIVHDARVLSNAGDTTPGHERSPLRSADRRSVRGGIGAVGTTITVDVAPQDALALRTAEQMGKLSLIMRSQHDGKAAAVSEFSATDFNTGRRGREPQKPECNRGRVRIDGREYVVDCDGNISQVVNPFEP
jgi:Flp pilus assembly protein CpaB